jgi:hypothetical protein
MQDRELFGQIPALQWRRLVEGTDLLLQKGQVVHRIEHHVGLLIRPNVSCDHLGPASNDDLMHIAADLNLMMGEGDRDGIIVAAVADHRD